VQVYRRQFAQRLVHGTQSWYFDLGGGWYESPELEAEFRRQAEILGETAEADCSPCAEVAAVVSERSPLFHRGRTLLGMHQVDGRLRALYCDRATEDLYRAGVAVDWYLSSDLARADLRRYKAVYFFNLVAADDAERAAVEALKSDGRTLIFLWAPGYVYPPRHGIEGAERLTGMCLRPAPCRGPAHVRVTDYATPMTRELDCTETFGTDMVFEPLLVVDDPDAVAFGAWTFNGLPAAAFKRCRGWTSVVLGTSTADRALLRAVFRDAGCTIRSEVGDIVYENRSVIAIHTCTWGSHILRVPECGALQDLFSGQVYAAEGGAVHLGRLHAYQTRVYRKLTR
jgi:hypothetical protein